MISRRELLFEEIFMESWEKELKSKIGTKSNERHIPETRVKIDVPLPLEPEVGPVHVVEVKKPLSKEAMQAAIDEAVNSSAVGAPERIFPKTKKSFFVIFLGLVIIIVLSMAILIVGLVKTGYLSLAPATIPTVEVSADQMAGLQNRILSLEDELRWARKDAELTETRSVQNLEKLQGLAMQTLDLKLNENVPNPLEDRINGLDSKLETLQVSDDEIQALRDQLNKWTSVVRRNYERVRLLGLVSTENAYIIKSGADKGGLMLITPDWKLEGMPKYTILHEKDKDFFKNQIKVLGSE